MGGIEGLMAESNERWAKADRRAQGLADNGLGEAVKNYYIRFVPAGVVILAGIGTVGAVLAFQGSFADWQSYLLFGVMLAGLGILVGGLIYNSKKVVPAAEYGKVDVTLSLTGEERKQIRRQIAGKAAVIPEQLTITRGAAVQMRKALATQLLLMPFYPLLFIPQAVRQVQRDEPFGWVFAAFICVLMVGIVFLVRDSGARAGSSHGQWNNPSPGRDRGTLNATAPVPA